MLANSPSLSQEQVDELARSWFREELQAGEHHLQLLRPDDPDDVEREAKRAQRMVEGAVELIRTNDWPVAEEIARDLLSGQCIELRRDDPSFQDLCRKILRVAAEAAHIYVARYDGDYSDRVEDVLFKPQPPAPITSAPAAPPAPPADTSPLLFDLIEKHVAGSKWEPQTRKQNEGTSRFLRDHLGDVRVSQVERRQVSEFLAALGSLPNTYGKAPK